MKRVICLVVCLMVLIIPAVIAAEAVSIDGVVYDRIDLFTESEVKSLNDEAEKHFGSLPCKIYIVTAQMPDYIGEDFTAEYDVSSNSIVLIIADNSKRNYNMYTYGDADWRITNPEVDAIL
ncbi:MAG: hypothetical protein IJY04_10850, partial [Clostridia bacterium]|nr:hypothetical protein [Clostridia bacterium]